MRILRCIDSLKATNGGPSYSLLESSKLLCEKGHEVTIICLDVAADVQLPIVSGLSILLLGPARGKFRIGLNYWRWLAANIKNFDRATVHGVWQFASFAFYQANWRARLPYIVMPHGSLDVWDRHLRPLNFLAKQFHWTVIERSGFRAARKCFFTSNDERVASAQLFDLRGVSCGVVPYGVVDRGVFRTQAKPTDRNRLIYLGRLHQKKGLELLLEAFSTEFANVGPAELLIAGSGRDGYVEELRVLAGKLGISQKVKWLGHLATGVKEEVLASSGLFVLPSYQENFGLAVAESLSCGTPVAVSTGVNTWRTIRERDAGLTFERSLEGLRDALRKWRDSSICTSEIRQRARNCFLENFSISKYAATLEEVLA